MKKILVTGGAGFIGSNLVRLLVEEKGLEVVNVDKLTYAGHLTSLEGLQPEERHHFVQADLCDADALKQVFCEHQPTAVMHLAAESHVDRSIDGPAEFIHSNIVGTYQLLQSALHYYESLGESQQDHFRFLHVSTDEVYGSLGLEEEAFSETTRYDPHSPYSASKAASDHLARAWQDTYGLPVLVTNCSNNYGPYQYPEKLIPVVLLNALEGKPVPIYGTGENVRDWLYVKDHAEALYTVLCKGRVGETYNIGGNNEQTNRSLVTQICTILDELRPAQTGRSYTEQIQFVVDRPGHDLRYAINPSKIRDELGWSPQESPESGLRNTIVWYLEHEEWWRNILA